MFRLLQTVGRSIAGLMIVGLALAPGLSAAASQPRDNDANAIMYNGAYSKTEWDNKLKNGDTKNSSSNLKQIYFNEGRGITESNFLSNNTVDGTVYKDGRVVVNGKTVATSARSVGRDFMAGSVKSGSVWERPTSVSFAADSIPAFVNMEGGVFRYAIIKSCGNPVKATATTKPSPSVSPKPNPSPAPDQSFSCVKLEVTQPDKDKRPGLYRFSVNHKQSGVTVTGFRFSKSLNGGTPAVVDTSATTNSYEWTLGPGDWTVSGQMKTSAGITAVSPECSATIKLTKASPSPSPSSSPKPSPSPTPTKGQVLSATLPDTGAETVIGGAMGLTALGYMGRAYLRSRRDVLDALRGKRPSNDK